MRRWRIRLAAVGSATVLTASLAVGTVAAQGSSLEPVPPASGDEIDAPAGGVSPRLAEARGEISAFVEVAEEAAIDAFNAERANGERAAANAGQRARGAALEAVETVVGGLRTLDSGTRLLGRTANAIPGAIVSADARTCVSSPNGPTSCPSSRSCPSTTTTPGRTS
ncbi:hypothetical protein [Saccharomonospora sp. CUA-673]|uniref:hypothetical protein n=1 Tax=Saccharomonospora sp. CUA-673 TaxID=1904969 RepID=UPI002101B479|nr:hypothetical protein [Saccharomonospora sp. CUA-673]